MEQIKVDKGRTVVLEVKLGFDVSQSVITSDIRVDKDPRSDLIATWAVSFLTDGTDGDLLLTLDESITQAITKAKGYMDLKKVTGGKPVSVFSEPLEVLFRNVATG